MSVVTPSAQYGPFDDTPTTMSDHPCSNGKISVALPFQFLAHELNTLAGRIPRVLSHPVWVTAWPTAYLSVAGVTCIGRAYQADTRKNSTTIVGRFLTMPLLAGGHVNPTGTIQLTKDGTATAGSVLGGVVAGDAVYPYHAGEANVFLPAQTYSASATAVRIDATSTRLLAGTVHDATNGGLTTGTDCCIDERRFMQGQDIEDADVETFRAQWHDLMTTQQRPVVSCYTNTPDVATSGFTTTATGAGNAVNVLTGAANGAYAVTKPGWATWTRYCALGKRTTARLRCFVLASMSGSTDTGTVVFVTQADTQNVVVTGTGHTWYALPVLSAYGDGTSGSLASTVGDWINPLAYRTAGTTNTLRITAVAVWLDMAT